MNFESNLYSLLPFVRASSTPGCSKKDEPSKTEEDLPPYSCSINKVGVYDVKIETDVDGKKGWHHPWKQVYFELRGTLFRLYKIKKHTSRYIYTPTFDYYQQYKFVPLLTLSLLDLSVSMASDYKKKPNVLRLRLGHFQCLMAIQTKADLYSWLDKITAAKRIAVDLDYP